MFIIFILVFVVVFFFFFQAEDGIRDPLVTGVQTCALPICAADRPSLTCRWTGRRPRYTQADISSRYIGRCPGTDGHARARHPRSAEGATPPRLRAEEAPRGDPRSAVGRVVRLAVPGAPPPGAGGRRRKRRR